MKVNTNTYHISPITYSIPLSLSSLRDPPIYAIQHHPVWCSPSGTGRRCACSRPFSSSRRGPKAKKGDSASDKAKATGPGTTGAVRAAPLGWGPAKCQWFLREGMSGGRSRCLAILPSDGHDSDCLPQKANPGILQSRSLDRQPRFPSASAGSRKSFQTLATQTRKLLR